MQILQTNFIDYCKKWCKCCWNFANN